MPVCPQWQWVSILHCADYDCMTWCEHYFHRLNIATAPLSILFSLMVFTSIPIIVLCSQLHTIWDLFIYKIPKTECEPKSAQKPMRCRAWEGKVEYLASFSLKISNTLNPQCEWLWGEDPKAQLASLIGNKVSQVTWHPSGPETTYLGLDWVQPKGHSIGCADIV